jgi:hypothetical protein
LKTNLLLLGTEYRTTGTEKENVYRKDILLGNTYNSKGHIGKDAITNSSCIDTPASLSLSRIIAMQLKALA